MALIKLNNNSIATGFGKVGQVIQSVKNTSTTITSTSYTTTSFTASITPTATSSKILISVSLTIDNNSDMRTDATLYRGSTNLFNGVNDNSAWISFNSIAEGRLILMQSNTYLDSPSSTSALTYTIYMKVQDSQATLIGADATSTLTLMEVLA
tara:strand:- start:55 stop:513 length:459 start_codon:yes stop_codon:yes gene_type:complete